jgi:hypothetical protein
MRCRLNDLACRSNHWTCGLLLAMTLLTSGCSGPAPAKNDAAASPAAGKTSADESRRKLKSAISRTQPQAMARKESRRDLIASGLNNWLSTCVEPEAREIKLSEASAALLSPAVRRAVEPMRFSDSDAIYLRDCQLLKAWSAAVWTHADSSSSTGAASDEERIAALFRRSVRDLALLPAEESRVPVGLFEVLLTGRGTLDDRILLFCEALRQRQVDSILIRAAAAGDPASADPAEAGDLLIGVVSGSKLLLFDPARGTPVPTADDAAALPTRVADASRLAGLDRWKAATLLIPCPPATFAPRMLILQQRLEAEDAAVLFEELAGGTSEIRPLMERISEVTAPIWPDAKPQIWDFPERSLAAALSLSEDQKQAFGLLMREFDGPFEQESTNVGNLLDDPNVNYDQLSPEQRHALRMQALAERMQKIEASSDELFGKPSYRLLEARIDQIMGVSDVAMIQDLQQIRIASLQEAVELEVPISADQSQWMQIPLPQAIRDVQQSAVGDALYWTSLCQMSRDDMGAAVSTLRNYRRQYPGQKFQFASLLNEVEALLSIGDNASAAAAATEADVDGNPERARAQWLRSRIPAGG